MKSTPSDEKVALEYVLSLWPVALSLSSFLPVGDLIALARTNSALRATLHGFGPAQALSDTSEGSPARESLYVGLHGTPYWQRLKESAIQVCSSKTHTRGDKIHSCRFCSKLICEACIVRSSFSRGKEDTFKNRCRFFCESCWENGNVSRTRRHPLFVSKRPPVYTDGIDLDVANGIFCTCTLKDNGWLCLECKDEQNYTAATKEVLKCHGVDCGNPVGEEHDRRRVCLWCNKTLPRHLGHHARFVWSQKIVEARTRNVLARQADMEEYNRRRLKLMRMSRREMRGDMAVVDDSEADKPQFIRHLDSCCNYLNFMSANTAPDGNAVYDSKRGYWRYSAKFLVRIGVQCKNSKQLRRNHAVRAATRAGSSVFSRTISQRRREQEQMWNMASIEGESIVIRLHSGRSVSLPISMDRAAQLTALKSRILDLAFVERLQFLQMQVALHFQYSLDLSWKEFRALLHVWGLGALWQDSSLSDEDFPTSQEAEGSDSADDGHSSINPSPAGRGTNSVRHSTKRRAPDTVDTFEQHAARIIERLVVAGKVLPLRPMIIDGLHDKDNKYSLDDWDNTTGCLSSSSDDEDHSDDDRGGQPQSKGEHNHEDASRPVRLEITRGHGSQAQQLQDTTSTPPTGAMADHENPVPGADPSAVHLSEIVLPAIPAEQTVYNDDDIPSFEAAIGFRTDNDDRHANILGNINDASGQIAS
jgi:hypothetical protein